MEITNSKHWHKIISFIPKILWEPLLCVFLIGRKIFYFGNRYKCPICLYTFSRYSGKDSQYGNCPKCDGASRQRALFLFLKLKTNFFTDNLKVLHFASEHCFIKQFRALKNLDYLNADIDSPRAMVKVDMTNIQYPDNYFDVLISSHVLEHVNNDMLAMKELFRVQDIKGWSIHLVPIDYSLEITFEDSNIKTPEDRKIYYGHFDHKRIYGVDYIIRLLSVGFTVNIYNVEDFLNNSEIIQYGIKPHEKIYYLTKS